MRKHTIRGPRQVQKERKGNREEVREGGTVQGGGGFLSDTGDW